MPVTVKKWSNARNRCTLAETIRVEVSLWPLFSWQTLIYKQVVRLTAALAPKNHKRQIRLTLHIIRDCCRSLLIGFTFAFHSTATQAYRIGCRLLTHQSGMSDTCRRGRNLRHAQAPARGRGRSPL